MDSLLSDPGLYATQDIQSQELYYAFYCSSLLLSLAEHCYTFKLGGFVINGIIIVNSLILVLFQRSRPLILFHFNTKHFNNQTDYSHR